jgi:hypothetical protein
VRGNNRSSPDVVARQRQAACRLGAVVVVAVLVVGVAGLSVAVLLVPGVLSAGKDWSGN